MEPTTYAPLGETREACCLNLKRRLAQEAGRYHLKRELVLALKEDEIHVTNNGQTLFPFKLIDSSQPELSCVVTVKMTMAGIKFLYKSSLGIHFRS